MRTPRLFVLLVSLTTALPPLARAAQVEATSSTQYLWYADPLANDKNQADLAEYLRLGATIDDAGKIRVFGYGRVIKQLTTSAESDEGWFGRLYYLYLDYRDAVKDHLDLRVGRTYVTQAAIPAVVDGGFLDLRNLGVRGLGVTAYGGHRATFDEKQEVDNFSDTVLGGSVYVDTALRTHAEVSYARRYTDGDLGREHVALEVLTTPHDALNVVARANYDLVASRWAELLLQANVTPWQPLTLRGEYYASRPSFDRFSFYSFFNVFQYQQVGGGLTLDLDPRWRVFADYAYEWFDGNANANLLEAGVSVRPIEPLILSASYEKRVGYAGGIDGLRFNGSYRIGHATLLAGADYADFRRDATETAYGIRSTSAKRFWAGLAYDITRAVGAIGRIEDDLSFYFSHAYKGFVALNVKL